MRKNLNDLSEAVSDLTRALVFCEAPAHVVTLLAQSLRYFDGNPDGATRFIVDAQREAYRRTQSPRARMLAQSLRDVRESEKKGKSARPEQCAIN
jgi:hypothetical protein